MLTNPYNQDTSITGHLKWSQIKEVPLYVHVSHVPTTVDGYSWCWLSVCCVSVCATCMFCKPVISTGFIDFFSGLSVDSNCITLGLGRCCPETRCAVYIVHLYRNGSTKDIFTNYHLSCTSINH